jgi:hypothetical protein
MTRLKRKMENSPLPNAVILEILVTKIGHWNKIHKGAKMPDNDNQGYHTISARS